MYNCFPMKRLCIHPEKTDFFPDPREISRNRDLFLTTLYGASFILKQTQKVTEESWWTRLLREPALCPMRRGLPPRQVFLRKQTLEQDNWTGSWCDNCVVPNLPRFSYDSSLPPWPYLCSIVGVWKVGRQRCVEGWRGSVFLSMPTGKVGLGRGRYRATVCDQGGCCWGHSQRD